jgi:hypothetical protein
MAGRTVAGIELSKIFDLIWPDVLRPEPGLTGKLMTTSEKENERCKEATAKETCLHRSLSSFSST